MIISLKNNLILQFYKHISQFLKSKMENIYDKVNFIMKI